MDVLEKPDVQTDNFTDVVVEYVEDDSPEVRTHIVNPPANVHIWTPGMTAQDIVDIARARSIEVKALCGYTWIPIRNPDKYPVCEKCMDLAGAIIKDMG